MTDLIQIINEWTTKIVALAWALFLLTWSIGWTLRGAPIPFARVKKVGAGFVEDAVWAAFWLAIGATVFKIVSYVVNVLSGAV